MKQWSVVQRFKQFEQVITIGKGNDQPLPDSIHLPRPLIFRRLAKALQQATSFPHREALDHHAFNVLVVDDYNLNFPHVGQVFAIEREAINKKTGKRSQEVVYGVTSQTKLDASPETILQTNRNHWCIENSCHYILDWVFDEDRCRIRTQYGPENINRLRRFVIGVIKAISSKGVAETTRMLAMNVRLVFDYLKMTKNPTKS